MPVSEARRKANERYNTQAYDEIKVRVSKGRKAELQAHAEQQNESLNGFINRAIDTQVEQDNRTGNGDHRTGLSAVGADISEQVAAGREIGGGNPAITSGVLVTTRYKTNDE